MAGRNGTNHGHPAPQNAYRVEVAGKPGLPDAAGASVLAQLPAIGVVGATEVRLCRLYELVGPLTQAQVHQIAKELLCDPITEEYRLGTELASPAFLVGGHWRVEVWLKPSVSDPHEDSILKAVEDLGLPRPSSARSGIAYKVIGRCPQAAVERIARKLLANPVIHAVKIAQL